MILSIIPFIGQGLLKTVKCNFSKLSHEIEFNYLAITPMVLRDLKYQPIDKGLFRL